MKEDVLGTVSIWLMCTQGIYDYPHRVYIWIHLFGSTQSQFFFLTTTTIQFANIPARTEPPLVVGRPMHSGQVWGDPQRLLIHEFQDERSGGMPSGMEPRCKPSRPRKKCTLFQELPALFVSKI